MRYFFVILATISLVSCTDDVIMNATSAEETPVAEEQKSCVEEIEQMKQQVLEIEEAVKKRYQGKLEKAAREKERVAQFVRPEV